MNNTEEGIRLSDAPSTIPVGDSRYPTQNTKEAVALSTVGIPFKELFPITNHYTKERPVSPTHPKAKPGEHGWRPGVITFHLAVTDEAGKSIKPLVDAYAENNADIKFDTLMEKLDEKIREERHLDASLIAIVEDIKAMYRPSLIVHIRRAMENHKHIIDSIFKAEELIKVRAGQGFKLVCKYASKATKRSLGL